MYCVLFTCGLLISASLTDAWPIAPFHAIANEIMEANKEATELEWRVANNSEEKASAQFFMATAIKELTELKEMMNASVSGTLAFRYELCVNRTSAKMPGFNQSFTRSQAMQRDDKLAPGMLEAQMDALYKAQTAQSQLTEELGECTLKCPTSSLLFLRRKSVLKALAPEPVEVLHGVANAIYSTSQSVDQMHHQLERDASAKQVLQSLTTSIMSKVLHAKKDIAKMEEDLRACNHQPDAARVGSAVADAMAGDADVADQMVSVAQASAKEAEDKVEILQNKLAECKRKCL
eukprot:gnl/MRDRNA2_/MRDRNA2_117296_c0_seq1.p1 gnl/MRDRNA2_/MRDRNA2_117296_c0~~gnl/MRDRNA2_/MRDRNA2_117296_c0_seq1.p1  ORF type:complete len:291 (+),score=68.03 gnl/MRDRNA2_/MRDRNA2_117296_c0_seq1:142-1014(+)